MLWITFILALARALDLTLDRYSESARALDLGLALDLDLTLDRYSESARALDLGLALALEFARDPAQDFAHDFARARARARALDLDLDLSARELARARDPARALDPLGLAHTLARARDFARARNLNELRRTQFNFRAALINYWNTMLPAVRSRSQSDLHFLIDRLQLLDDCLEGKAEPVEVIALVRRERPSAPFSFVPSGYG